eukprot:RCo032467
MAEGLRGDAGGLSAAPGAVPRVPCSLHVRAPYPMVAVVLRDGSDDRLSVGAACPVASVHLPRRVPEQRRGGRAAERPCRPGVARGGDFSGGTVRQPCGGAVVAVPGVLPGAAQRGQPSYSPGGHLCCPSRALRHPRTNREGGPGDCPAVPGEYGAVRPGGARACRGAGRPEAKPGGPSEARAPHSGGEAAAVEGPQRCAGGAVLASAALALPRRRRAGKVPRRGAAADAQGPRPDARRRGEDLYAHQHPDPLLLRPAARLCRPPDTVSENEQPGEDHSRLLAYAWLRPQLAAVLGPADDSLVDPVL